MGGRELTASVNTIQYIAQKDNSSFQGSIALRRGAWWRRMRLREVVRGAHLAQQIGLALVADEAGVHALHRRTLAVAHRVLLRAVDPVPLTTTHGVLVILILDLASQNEFKKK
jgi:hypothetical protein